MDLLMMGFAKWIKKYNIQDAYLLIHTAPTGDAGWDLDHLAEYLGLNSEDPSKGRFIYSKAPFGHGITEEDLRVLYCCCDLILSPSQNEGFGLPALEAMACGIPNAVVNYSAYTEWAQGAALFMPYEALAVTPGFVNSYGAVVSVDTIVETLQSVYTNRQCLLDLSLAGLELAERPSFRWEWIGQAHLQVFKQLLTAKPKEVAA
jgi:glycosyltransferase involved in cell wall biosynthesis